MQDFFELGLDNLDIIVDKLENLIDDKDSVVLLRGDLASGKTTLVKAFVKRKKIEDSVTSPTFSLQSIYDNTIFHYDVYNKKLDEFIALGMLEEFDKSGIHFVEWGDEKLENILKEYGFNVLILNIKKEQDKRRYSFE